jgi:hypothetical protein
MQKNKQTNDTAEAPTQDSPGKCVPEWPKIEVVHETLRTRARAVITRHRWFSSCYTVTLVTLDTAGKEEVHPTCISQLDLREAVDALIEARDWIAAQLYKDNGRSL